MKKTVDATRPLSFEITQEDVDQAVPLDKNHCVIANALRHKSALITHVSVGASVTRITMGDKITRYLTPNFLRDALNNFDTTNKWYLPPGSYKLYPPSPGKTLDAMKTRNETTNKDRERNKYGKTGRNKMHVINRRVIEFKKIQELETKKKEG